MVKKTIKDEMSRFLQKMEDSDSSQMIPYKTVHLFYNTIKRFCSDKNARDSDLVTFTKCLISYTQKVLYHMISKYADLTVSAKELFEKYVDPVKDVLVGDAAFLRSFVSEHSISIFDLISEQFHWSKLALLRIYLDLLITLPKNGTEDASLKINPHLIYTLIDMLVPCGDYEFQATIIEVIFHLFPTNLLQKYSRKGSFFPESKKWDDTFINLSSNLNGQRHDFDVASFLLVFNQNGINRTVITKLCKKIVLGNGVKCDKPTQMEHVSGIFVDFNIGSKSISWYCHRNKLLSHFMTELSEDETSCLLRISFTDISTFDVNGVKIEFELKADRVCICNFPQLQRCLTDIRKFTFSLDESEEINAKMLREIFQGIYPAKSSDSHITQSEGCKLSSLQPPSFTTIRLSSRKSKIRSAKTLPLTSSILNSPRRLDDASNRFENCETISSISHLSVKFSPKVSSVIQSKQVSSSNAYPLKISKPIEFQSGNGELVNRNSFVCNQINLSSLSEDMNQIESLTQFNAVEENRNEEEDCSIESYHALEETISSNRASSPIKSPIFNKLESFMATKITPPQNENNAHNSEDFLSDTSPVKCDPILLDHERGSETPTIIVSNNQTICSRKGCDEYVLKELRVIVSPDEISEHLQKESLNKKMNGTLSQCSEKSLKSVKESSVGIVVHNSGSIFDISPETSVKNASADVEMEKSSFIIRKKKRPFVKNYSNKSNRINSTLNVIVEEEANQREEVLTVEPNLQATTEQCSQKSMKECSVVTLIQNSEPSMDVDPEPSVKRASEYFEIESQIIEQRKLTPFVKSYSNKRNKNNATLNENVEEVTNQREDILDLGNSISQATTIPTVERNDIIVSAEVHEPKKKNGLLQSKLNVQQEERTVPQVNKVQKRKNYDLFDSVQIMEQDKKGNPENVKNVKEKPKQLLKKSRNLQNVEVTKNPVETFQMVDENFNVPMKTNENKENAVHNDTIGLNKSKRRLYDPEDTSYLEELSVTYASTKETKENTEPVFKKPRLSRVSLPSKRNSTKSTTSLKTIKKPRYQRNSYVLAHIRDQNVKIDSKPNDVFSFSELIAKSGSVISSGSKTTISQATGKVYKAKNIQHEKKSKINVLSNVLINPRPNEYRFEKDDREEEEHNSMNGNMVPVNVNSLVDIVLMVLKLVPPEAKLSIVAKVMNKLLNDSSVPKEAEILTAMLALLRSHKIE